MTTATTIQLSLATYKAIEAQRLSFGETHDAIIRRALAERAGRRSERAVPGGARGAQRQRGRVRVVLFGEARAAMNLRDGYLLVLTALTRHKASLLALLANEGSARRRWVARSAEALFVTAPHLARTHAHEIAPEWFVDTNVSRAQIMARLTVAARLAGLRFGEDVRLIED
jgi:hypothetical protein